MNTADYAVEVRNTDRSTVHFDPLLLTVYLLLVGLGVIAVYSATIAHAFVTDGVFGYFLRNGINVLFALAAFSMMSIVPVYIWQRYSPVLLLFGLVLLICVLVPVIGAELNGSRRWIRIGGTYFQPSELAEFAFVIFAADYLTLRRKRLSDFSAGVLPLVVAYLVFAVLLILEPDFGSVVVLGSVIFTMLFLNDAKAKHLAGLMIAGIGAIIVLIIFEPYRMMRLMAFLDPFGDSFASGFQLVQSLIAFGRGELFGVGIGNSVQKLFYLPYAESDFLLAIIAEEWGFAGISCVILLFSVLIWRIFHISWMAGQAGDLFGMNLAQGIGLLIAVSAMINMGVNMGALPTKGLTLPFMSEGGTSLIVYSAAIGCVFSIQRGLSHWHSESL